MNGIWEKIVISVFFFSLTEHHYHVLHKCSGQSSDQYIYDYAAWYLAPQGVFTKGRKLHEFGACMVSHADWVAVTKRKDVQWEPWI